MSASKPPKQVVCLSCFVRQDAWPKRTFLGFPTFVCESCNEASEYPLSTGYVAIYALSAFVALRPMITGRGNGGCFLVLGIAAIPALWLHVRATRRLEIAEASAKSHGDRVADTFR